MYHHIDTDFSLSKEQLMKIYYPSLYENRYKGWSFDYSIPQTWVDWVLIELPDVSRKTMFMFVWLYEPDGCIMGEPLPLTKEAQDVLIRLNELEKQNRWDEMFNSYLDETMPDVIKEEEEE